jgi:pilus assembly protein TadC
MLLLTPGFWLLLLTSDARHTLSSLAKPAPRTAVVLGVALQLLGALWIGAIVNRAAGARPRARWMQLPVLRAGSALIGGRTRENASEEIADAAETIAFVLDAGSSPSAALRAVAPLVHGETGTRLRSAAARLGAGERLADAMRACEIDARLVDAFDASMSLGVPLAPALRDLADDVRERAAMDLSENVRRASVRVLVPLGLLILPAFVLSCLVPLFAGGLVGLSGS